MLSKYFVASDKIFYPDVYNSFQKFGKGWKNGNGSIVGEVMLVTRLEDGCDVGVL